MAENKVLFVEIPITGKRVRMLNAQGQPSLSSPVASVIQNSTGEYTIRTNSGSIYIGKVQVTNEPRPVSTAPAPSYNFPVVIDLNKLKPLESFILDALNNKLTEAQTVALIKQKNLDIKAHPFFTQLWNSSNRDFLIVCTHSSHNTEEKRTDCLISQAEKMVVKTLRKHIQALENHRYWQKNNKIRGYDENEPGFLMWVCGDHTNHTPCPACSAREGVIERAGMSRIEVMHIDCHCEQVFLSSGSYADDIIRNTYEELGKSDAQRAYNFMQNVAKSGWKPSVKKEMPDYGELDTPQRKSSRAGGCCVVPIILILIVFICLVFVLNIL